MTATQVKEQTLVHFYEPQTTKLQKQLATEVELISELMVDSPRNSSLELDSSGFD